MKSFIVAVVILCIIIFGMCLHEMALSRANQELNEILEDIQISIIDKEWDRLSEETNRLNDKWDQMSKWMSCVIEHDEIDNIMISVASIKEYARYREIPELMAELSALYELINHIPIKERLLPQNIL